MGFVFRRHDFTGNRHFAQLLLVRHLIHQVEHQVFDDHAEAARADLAFERDSAIASSASSVKRSFTFSYSKSFMYWRVIAFARLREDLDERRLVQFVQRAHDGQATDELRESGRT